MRTTPPPTSATRHVSKARYDHAAVSSFSIADIAEASRAINQCTANSSYQSTAAGVINLARSASGRATRRREMARIRQWRIVRLYENAWLKNDAVDASMSKLIPTSGGRENMA